MSGVPNEATAFLLFLGIISYNTILRALRGVEADFIFIFKKKFFSDLPLAGFAAYINQHF